MTRMAARRMRCSLVSRYLRNGYLVSGDDLSQFLNGSSMISHLALEFFAISSSESRFLALPVFALLAVLHAPDFS